jgi:hypothetical protein
LIPQVRSAPGTPAGPSWGVPSPLGATGGRPPSSSTSATADGVPTAGGDPQRIEPEQPDGRGAGSTDEGVQRQRGSLPASSPATPSRDMVPCGGSVGTFDDHRSP